MIFSRLIKEKLKQIERLACFVHRCERGEPGSLCALWCGIEALARLPTTNQIGCPYLNRCLNLGRLSVSLYIAQGRDLVPSPDLVSHLLVAVQIIGWFLSHLIGSLHIRLDPKST